MDKIKKVYIDSRYKSADSNSNSDFKFELREVLDLPDNTVCYIDDISIPHSWYTVEDYNNRLYIEHENSSTGVDDYIVIVIPPGNYNGVNLAAAMQTAIQERFPAFNCIYNAGRGTITISNPYTFRILTEPNALLMQQLGKFWLKTNGVMTILQEGELNSINDVLRHSVDIPIEDRSTTFETEFLDLINAQNIYLHCPNLGHYNCVGVRGENSIVKKVPVSSSFGYMILDSVVAPHDKIDVSRQSIKTLHFTLKNVHGNIINLHGAHCSWSLIFQTIE